MIEQYEQASIYADGYLRQDQQSPTPTIDKYCRNLNKEAAMELLSPVIGRDWEVDRMANILSKRKNSNPLLIGEAGVGKTALVEALAQRIVDGSAPKCLQKKIIYELSLSSLNAGTGLRGSTEERIDNLLKELQASKNVILFIDEVHLVVGLGTGSSQVMDLSNMLKPAMASGSISIIGSTTLDEYDKHISKDKALTRRFSNVIIDQPTDEQAKAILDGVRNHYEGFHGVLFNDAILKRVIVMAKEYFRDECLPASAITLLDEIGAFGKNNPRRWTKGGNVLTVDDAYTATSSVVQVPKNDIKKNVEKILKKK